MTENQIADFILKTTYTTTDLHRRMNTLREFLEYKFFTSMEPQGQTLGRRETPHWGEHPVPEDQIAQGQVRGPLGTGKENEKFDDFAIEKFIPSSDMMIISKWDETFGSSFTKVNIYKLLDKLKSLLQNFPVITFYLPFAPDENEILTLTRWLKKNVHPQVLIDLRKNEALVLGCAFAWKGVYHDFSLHYFLEKNRHALLNLISNYAPNFSHI